MYYPFSLGKKKGSKKKAKGENLAVFLKGAYAPEEIWVRDKVRDETRPGETGQSPSLFISSFK